MVLSLSLRPRSRKQQILWTSVFLLVLLTSSALSLFQKVPSQSSAEPRIGGLTWWLRPYEQNSALRPPIDLGSVYFISERTGWAMALDGSILSTNDAGRSWHLQFRGSSHSPQYPSLVSVLFATPELGWAAGPTATILHTQDSGRSWQKEATGSSAYIHSVYFLTPAPQVGWAVGPGTILRTETGGSSWEPQPSGTWGWLNSVFFLNQQVGWVVGDEGTILYTQDEGRTWSPQHSQQRQFLRSVTFVNPQVGWAVGLDQGQWPRESGVMLHTEDAGRTWIQRSDNTLPPLASVFFLDSQWGWIVGKNGAILDTDDGGHTWQQQPSGSSAALNSVFFSSGSSGWIVGNGGIILHTTNRGRTWTRQGYRIWPAPWFFLTAIICVTAILQTSRSVLPQQLDSIEETEDSDSPVETLQQDTLGYGPLVERLRRFIQNTKTEPPLVVALQAPWGMGKSSVMRMLQSELQRNRVAVTVWFNAWHHQKEDPLLAYLLEEIQKQVAPSWLSPVGLAFRFKLVRVRVFSSLDGFFAVFGALLLVVFHEQLTLLLETQPALKNFKNINSVGQVLWLVPVLLLYPQLRAFSSHPAKLLDEANNSSWQWLKSLVSFGSLKGKTDVRPEFSKDLREVVEALLPQRLVIFLDDLDRCRAELVVETLEAVNFLSSAAPCFIVLGADYRKVETLAGMRFETIAKQEAENVGAKQPVDRVQVRLEHARNYMRKIVNMRLNLPHPSPTAYQSFLTQRRATEKRSFRTLQGGLLAAIGFAAVVLFALQPVFYHPEQQSSLPTVSSGNPEVSNSPGNLSPLPPITQQAGPEQRRATQGTGKTPDSHVVSTDDMERLIVIFGILVLSLGGCLVRILSQPKHMPEARDSAAFKRALQDSSLAIQERANTPREMRRFMNYLRFIAGPSDSAKPGEGADFEPQLVWLAATGLNSQAQKLDQKVIQYYRAQCDLIGVDPETFRPRDE